MTKNTGSALLGSVAPVIALAVSIPIFIIVFSIFNSHDSEVWDHLVNTVLDDYVINSLLLMLGVGFLVFLLGVPSAWFIAVCDFPGRQLFSWALLLPLAFPAYIIAYTYTGILDFAGPVQSWIRDITGWGYGDYWFPRIRSLGGAIVMLGLVLYPYVYLLTRASLLERSSINFESCRTLGYSYPSLFFRLAIPITRPAIVTGISLALMETLADYGTVQFFGVSTFTTGIFRTFYGLDELTAALQLSAMLLGFVALLIFLERYSRRKTDYQSTGQNSLHDYRIQLRGIHRFWAWMCCFLPILFGFIVPALILIKWTIFDAELSQRSFFDLVVNSFFLALSAALIAVALGLILSYARRVRNTPVVKTAISVSGLGYAIPGTIVAIGIIVPLAWIDHRIIDLVESLTSRQIGLVFSGTILALLLAYTVRFLAISLGTIQSGLEKIRPELDDAARSLGRRTIEVLRHVHIPLMRSTVLTALLIVFVDVLKELPATLILRPFDFNTLAVRAYELASDERLVDAALPSVTIVMVGVIPVILLNKFIAFSK